MSRWSVADWVRKEWNSNADGLRGSSRDYRRRVRRAAARCRRVFLEPLEDRRLLALTITVNSAADPDVRDNVLTFREAIEVSNATLPLAALTNLERQQVVPDGNTTNS